LRRPFLQRIAQIGATSIVNGQTEKLKNVMAVTEATGGVLAACVLVRMASRVARGSALQKGNLRPHLVGNPVRLPTRACREIAMAKSEKSTLKPLLVMIVAAALTWALAMVLHSYGL
jgi:hypothetical protein